MREKEALCGPPLSLSAKRCGVCNILQNEIDLYIRNHNQSGERAHTSRHAPLSISSTRNAATSVRYLPGSW